ncbi:pimeloyl-ACP methyl ester carboxylesterase [Marmoricola sp. URHA0025 HA25]
MARVVLVHGAATSARVWDRLAPLLVDHDVVSVARPRTGDLARELAWLAPRVEGAWVVGMSGGATLGLALASGPVPLAGAILHEPAVGTLAPGLLDPMVRAFEAGGTTAFARMLYGGAWAPALFGGPLEDAVTARELMMFRGFEPEPLSATCGRVVVTVGERSPAIRHASVEALRSAYGHDVLTVPRASHFAAYEAPHQFAATVLAVINGPQ